ncbi:MAG: hypothetical protein RL660_2381 [Bacteroidota bacterium]|jgi:uncharacterized protein
MVGKNKAFIIELLQQKLPAYLTYHSYEHTLHVYDNVEMIAKHEGVVGTELELLQMAALFHDIGFIEGREEHEARGCVIAKPYLQDWHYSMDQIALINGMIMATKIPQQARTQLERILADADLAYLGTDNYDEISDLLLKELRFFNPSLSEKDWLAIQIKFLQQHTYHTEYCRTFRDEAKQRNLAKLVEQYNLYDDEG